jgi:hypothetical protein
MYHERQRGKHCGMTDNPFRTRDSARFYAKKGKHRAIALIDAAEQISAREKGTSNSCP